MYLTSLESLLEGCPSPALAQSRSTLDPSGPMCLCLSASDLQPGSALSQLPHVLPLDRAALWPCCQLASACQKPSAPGQLPGSEPQGLVKVLAKSWPTYSKGQLKYLPSLCQEGCQPSFWPPDPSQMHGGICKHRHAPHVHTNVCIHKHIYTQPCLHICSVHITANMCTRK